MSLCPFSAAAWSSAPPSENYASALTWRPPSITFILSLPAAASSAALPPTYNCGALTSVPSFRSRITMDVFSPPAAPWGAVLRFLSDPDALTLGRFFS